MEKLVWVVNNEFVTDSRLIAKYFHKEHGKVLRKIRKLRKQGCTEGFFIESKFLCEQNHQMFTNYFITYDGFTLLFNGKDLDDTKMMFIKAFEDMSTLADAVPKKKKRNNDKEIIAFLEKEMDKQEPLVLFADMLLCLGDCISLHELSMILSHEDKATRKQAMIDWLHSKGYSLPTDD